MKVQNDYAITKDDVKRMRCSTTICVDMFTKDSDRTSQIRMIKERKDDFGSYDTTEAFPVDATFETYIKGFYKDYNSFPNKCFAHLRCYSHTTDPIQTFAAFLRAGDVITAHWVASEGNGYLSNSRCNMDEPHYRNEPVYQDQLYLKISRGKKIHVFYIEDRIGPRNSAAMIQ